MESMDEQGGEQQSENQDSNPAKERRRERRMDTASLFGGYQGPERRSGRDRRATT